MPQTKETNYDITVGEIVKYVAFATAAALLPSAGVFYVFYFGWAALSASLLNTAL